MIQILHIDKQRKIAMKIALKKMMNNKPVKASDRGLFYINRLYKTNYKGDCNFYITSIRKDGFLSIESEEFNFDKPYPIEYFQFS